MSGFIVGTCGQITDLREIEEHYKKPIAAFHRKGMTLSGIHLAHGHAVLLFANPWHDPVRETALDTGGQFCTYVGTLLYKNATGKAASSELLNDLQSGRLDCMQVANGNFCVIVNDLSALRIITDRAGLHHVFRNGDFTFISNSFLATACAVTSRTLSEQEALEYIFFGATFGEHSVIKEVQLVDAGSVLRMQRGGLHGILKESVWNSVDHKCCQESVGQMLERTLADADEYYRQIESCFGSKVTASLSGGHDSRLSLALLRRSGIDPRLFVYGAPSDPDVRIARLICESEGLELTQIDRAASRMLDPDEYWQNQESVFHGLDGRTQYGFACDPWEMSHRRERVDGGLVAINGGGGEIWRDYWKVPFKAMTAAEFVSAYYGGRTTGLNRSGSGEQKLLRGIAEKVCQVVGYSGRDLSPAVIQSLYARFRVRYWQGANNSIDNHVGYALTPFAETRFSVPAMWIPARAKRLGWFERQLIIGASPSLARYPSSHGYNLEKGPGLRQSLAAEVKSRLPLWIRKLRRRTVQRQRPSYFHSPKFLSARFGSAPLEVEKFVKLDELKDNLAVSRALTIERFLRGEWYPI